MAFEPKEGMGSFFQNDKKGNEKAPDYRGEVMIAGNIYKLAGWKKLTAKGDPMLSLKAEVKGAAPDAYQAPKKEPAKIDAKDPFGDMEDDITF